MRTRAVALVALLVWSVHGAAAAQGFDEPLMWAPPDGWEAFEEFVVPPEGGAFDLDPDVDYRIGAPEVITGQVALRGGRHVVWIGGEWDISNYPTPAGSATDRRALMIRDRSGNTENRIVHLEGLLIGGSDLSEGIDVAAPTVLLQIQNVHVAGVYLRGADDRDRTGPYDVDGWSGNHADVLQPWGGYREIRIDGLTGRTMYQGFYHVDDLGDTGNATRTFLRRMNLEAVSRVGPDDGFTYTGHRLFRWDESKSGQIFVDNGTVWAQHHPGGSWVDGEVYRHAYRERPDDYPEYDVIVADPAPGTAVFADTFFPEPEIGTDDLGEYAWWEQALDNGLAAVRNWNDDGPGRFYSGAPPGGDYVPAELVGRDYRSPGYRDPDSLALSRAPVAINDVVVVDEGGVARGEVSTNDLDLDSAGLTFTLLTPPEHGAVDLSTDGAFVYSHDGSESRNDAFVYVVDDGRLRSAPATVNITVTHVNDRPVAVDDVSAVDRGGEVTIAVLANDVDADGDALTPKMLTPPEHGVASVEPDGTITYEHDGSQTDSDQFTYVVQDGALTSDHATSTIAVGPGTGGTEGASMLVLAGAGALLAFALAGAGVVRSRRRQPVPVAEPVSLVRPPGEPVPVAPAGVAEVPPSVPEPAPAPVVAASAPDPAPVVAPTASPARDAEAARRCQQACEAAADAERFAREASDEADRARERADAARADMLAAAAVVKERWTTRRGLEADFLESPESALEFERARVEERKAEAVLVQARSASERAKQAAVEAHQTAEAAGSTAGDAAAACADCRKKLGARGQSGEGR